MEEQLISFETAKLVKEKEFDWCCRFYFSNKEERDCFDEKASPDNYNSKYWNKKDSTDDIWTSRPTQSLLQKWLREVHNCFIDILPHRDGDSKNRQWKSKKDVFWTVEVNYYGKNFEIELTEETDFTQNFNNSYEEALEIGLQEALKLIK
jgi:hypothetical protein